jgi:hypothetical protein
MPCEGERNSLSESGQTGAIKAIPYLSYTPYTKGSIRRVKEKYIRRRMIYNSYKEKKASRPLIGRDKQSKDN